MPEPSIRVFVSSPADLDQERALVRDILATLAQEYRPYFRVQAVLWEDEALSAAQSFQAGLLRPSACDIVLVMLWTGLGTPLAEHPYGGMTGTEWELMDALAASARQGIPEVLVYRKTAPHLVNLRQASSIREALAECERLEDFFRAQFFNADGSFRRAFRDFETAQQLRVLVETQLRKLLNRRISAERRLTTGSVEWRGSPFRADGPFAIADAPIFTGRESELRALLQCLDAARAPAPGCVMVAGPSGVGKTSLLHAGLLPQLTRPVRLSRVANCRWCLVDMAQPEPDVALAAAVGGAGAIGAALQGMGLATAQLAALIASSPAVAAAQIQAALLRAATSDEAGALAHPGQPYLAILLDPLEPLLQAVADGRPSAQAALAALVALAEREGIWVIGALRSDRLALLAAAPALVALLRPPAWLWLAPLGTARIRQVLEIPARLAGIAYEEAGAGPGGGLVELLEAEASQSTHWPVLLQPLLAALYARAEPAAAPPGSAPRLSLADYRRLGGLRGHLVARADRLWQSLSAEVRAGLPRLCRALVALEGGSRSHPAPRTGDLEPLRRDAASAALLDACVAARLIVVEAVREPAYLVRPPPLAPTLVGALRVALRQIWRGWRGRRRGSGDADVPALAAAVETLVWSRGLPEQPAMLDAATPAAAAAPIESAPSAETLSPLDTALDPAATAAPHFDPTTYRAVGSFVHPALVLDWSPVRHWLADAGNRRDLVLRQQLGRQARLWKRTDGNREHLLSELGYAAARDYGKRHPDELEPLECELLAHSHAQLRLQRQRNRLAFSTALLLLSSGLGVAIYSAWEASRAAELSRQHQALTEAELAIERGNTPEALRLAWPAGAVLPDAAAQTLGRAVAANRLIARLVPAAAKPLSRSHTVMAPDGERLATLEADGTAAWWRLDGNRLVRETGLTPSGMPIHALVMAAGPDQEQLLGIGTDGVWRLPASLESPPDWDCGKRVDQPALLSPDGRHLALVQVAADGATGICLLDLQEPGKPLWNRPLHRGEIRTLAFAPRGERLMTGGRDGLVRVLATRSGAESLVLPPGGTAGRPLNRAVFDAKGERIATAAWDESIRVYDAAGRERAILGAVRRGERQVKIHQSSIRDLVFTPDGEALVAGDRSGQVVRWDLKNGGAEVLGTQETGILQLSLAPRPDLWLGEHLVLSLAEDGRARLWRLETGRHVAELSQQGPITRAQFAADGSRILTQSGADGAAWLWSAAPHSRLVTLLPQQDQVYALATAAVPHQAAGRSDERPVQRPAASPDERSERRPDQGPAQPPEQRPDRADAAAIRLAIGGHDGRIELWEWDAARGTADPRLVVAEQVHAARVRALELTADGRIASAGADGMVRLFDPTTAQDCLLGASSSTRRCARPGASDCPDVFRVRVAPGGEWLVTASDDAAQPVRLWDAQRCRPLDAPPSFAQITGGVRALDLVRTAAGTLALAVGATGGGLWVLQRSVAGDWRLQCAPQQPLGSIQSLRWSIGGRWLAVANREGSAHLLEPADPASCARPAVLDPAAGALSDLDFAPDGQALATASADGVAHLWSLDGTLLAVLPGHRSRVTSIGFSPDGDWILTGARDGRLRLWRRPRRAQDQPLAPYQVFDADLGAVSSALFTSDGRRIGAGYWDQAALLWHLWDAAPDQQRVRHWGADRARLAVIGEAQRLMAAWGVD